MVTLGGLILILAAFYAGVPPQVLFDGPLLGIALLIIGVGIVTWRMLKRFQDYIDHMPLGIGAVTLGYFGLYHQDYIGTIFGVLILLAWARLARLNATN